AVLVGLVAELGYALDLLSLDQLGNAFDQPCLVQLVGNLGDDNGLAAGFFVPLHLGPGAHQDAAAAGAVGLHDAGTAVDDGAGGKIRPRNVLHQLVDGQLGIVDQGEGAVDHLGQVVGWNIGGHAHRDAGGAIDQQVGNPGGHHLGNLLLAVVVVHPVDGLLVQVRQQGVGNLGHADFGVTHGGGGVAVDGAEVTLAVHQHVAHGKRLRHAHDGVVDRRVAVGVVLTDHVAHHPGGFLVRLVPVVFQLAHGEQDAPVNRFQAVADVRQGAADDNTHGIVEVGLLQLVLDTDGLNFSGYITHRLVVPG